MVGGNHKPPERGNMKYAKKTENVHVRVSPETKKLLELLGSEMKMSNTEIIEKALEVFYKTDGGLTILKED
jgi:hypothetical protein